MQTKRTKKAGIVGKYGKFDKQICPFAIKFLRLGYEWGDVLLFCAFVLLGWNNGRLWKKGTGVVWLA
jgi:hypothetical protein